MDAVINCQHAAGGYGDRVVFRSITCAINAGDRLCIVGPNGVGKSTLVKTLLGLRPLREGAITMAGVPVAAWAPAQRARQLAYVPQVPHPPVAFAVRDVVLMGRVAMRGMFATPTADDHAQVDQALATMGIAHLAHQRATRLSGGERQLVLIARALAQQPRVLLLDEPLAHLDYGHQLAMLRHLAQVSTLGVAVVMTTHMPEHAFWWATQVLTLHRDGTARVGTPQHVLTAEKLTTLYGTAMTLVNYQTPEGHPMTLCGPAAGVLPHGPRYGKE